MVVLTKVVFRFDKPTNNKHRVIFTSYCDTSILYNSRIELIAHQARSVHYTQSTNFDESQTAVLVRSIIVQNEAHVRYY